MNLQEQIRLHKEISQKIEELEQQKKALSIAIMQQMASSTLQVPGYFVRRLSRLSIKLSVEQARSMNAVKMEETVDKDKIKALYKSGHPIEGVNEIHYIQVSLAPSKGSAP